MTITFDLNTRLEEDIDQTLWDSLPLDTVMIIAALGRSPDEPETSPAEPDQSRIVARDVDDDQEATSEDAEWQ